MSGLDLSRTVARGKGHRDTKTVGGTPWPIDNLRILYHMIKKICIVYDFITSEVRGQSHSCPKVLR